MIEYFVLKYAEKIKTINKQKTGLQGETMDLAELGRKRG